MPLIYSKAMLDLADALDRYVGEPIGPGEGDGEHPVHLAVRVAEEATQAARGASDPTRGGLTPEGRVIWFRLLAYCRDFTATKSRLDRFVSQINRWESRSKQEFVTPGWLTRIEPEPQPTAAKEAAMRLRAWAISQAAQGKPKDYEIGKYVNGN